MQKYLGFSYLTSFGALGVATCCVLPITMMLLGLGGSWLAVFGKIAAASYYVLAVASVAVIASWAISFQRKSITKLKWGLAGTTAMTALAWIVVVNETPINDFLITQM